MKFTQADVGKRVRLVAVPEEGLVEEVVTIFDVDEEGENLGVEHADGHPEDVSWDYAERLDD